MPKTAIPACAAPQFMLLIVHGRAFARMFHEAQAKPFVWRQKMLNAISYGFAVFTMALAILAVGFIAISEPLPETSPAPCAKASACKELLK